jgi:hypothetical protein
MAGKLTYGGKHRLNRAFADGRIQAMSAGSSTSPFTANTPDDLAWDAGYAATAYDETQSIGTPRYSQTRVTFDGSNDYLTKTGMDLSGEAPWEALLVSFTIAPGAATDGTVMRIMESNLPLGAAILIINRNASNKLVITLRRSGVTKAAITTGTSVVAGSRYNVVWSVDVKNGATKCYINGIKDTTTNTTLASNDTWGSGEITDLGIGAAVAGTTKLNGSLGDLWVWWGAASALPNLDTPSVRGRWQDLTGPQNPGASPARIFYGGTQTVANWNAGTNLGSLGDFTMTGAVA